MYIHLPFAFVTNKMLLSDENVTYDIPISKNEQFFSVNFIKINFFSLFSHLHDIIYHIKLSIY